MLDANQNIYIKCNHLFITENIICALTKAIYYISKALIKNLLETNYIFEQSNSLF